MVKRLFHFLFSLRAPLVLLALSFLTFRAQAADRSADRQAALEREEFMQSVELLNKGEVDKSQAILKRLVGRSRANGLYWFNLGHTYLMKNNPSAALTCYENVEKYKSRLAPFARLYKARSLLQLKRGEEAKKILLALRDDPETRPGLKAETEATLAEFKEPQEDPDAELKENALALYRSGKYDEADRLISSSRSRDKDLQLLKDVVLRQIKREREFHPQKLWYFADVSSGYGSNVYADPESSTVKTGGGVARALAGVGGRAWSSGAKTSESYSLFGGYQLKWDETFGIGDLRVLNHALSAFFAREIPGSLLQVGAFTEHESWANQAVTLKSGLRAKLRAMRDRIEYGAEMAAAWISSQNSSYNYLGGSRQDLRLFTGLVVDPIYAQLYLDIKNQATGDQVYSDGSVRPYAYRGWGPGATLAWKSTDEWVFSATVSAENRSYPTRASPGNKERQDQELDMGIRISRIIDSTLNVYLAYSQSMSHSTLGSSDAFDQNINTSTALVGTSWDAQTQ